MNDIPQKDFQLFHARGFMKNWEASYRTESKKESEELEDKAMHHVRAIIEDILTSNEEGAPSTPSS